MLRRVCAPYGMMPWASTTRHLMARSLASANVHYFSSAPAHAMLRESAREPVPEKMMSEADLPVVWQADLIDDGTRLDRFIKRRAPGLPPGLIQRLIRQRRVVVNAEPAIRNAHPLRPDDKVYFPSHIKLGLTRGKKAPPPDDVSLAESEHIRRCVLHRDSRCIVLNKPPGLAVQGGSGLGEHHLERLLIGLGGGRCWLVHRLDKEVAGAIVVARDVGAAGLLAEHFRSRDVKKVYWGLVAGGVKEREGVIDRPVDGKRAITKFRVLGAVEKMFTWLELRPQTGRKHQLRLHCAEGLEAPLVGDERYGWTGRSEGGLEALQGPGLHLLSRTIEFPRLTGGGGAKRAKKGEGRGVVSVTAPLPPHMKETWDKFGLEERLI